MTDHELIELMHELEGPAFTAGELADHVDMTPQGVRNRLEQLKANGRVHKKKPSNRTVMWWADDDHDIPALSA